MHWKSYRQDWKSCPRNTDFPSSPAPEVFANAVFTLGNVRVSHDLGGFPQRFGKAAFLEISRVFFGRNFLVPNVVRGIRKPVAFDALVAVYARNAVDAVRAILKPFREKAPMAFLNVEAFVTFRRSVHERRIENARRLEIPKTVIGFLVFARREDEIAIFISDSSVGIRTIGRVQIDERKVRNRFE
jgi:hypothetical protein